MQIYRLQTGDATKMQELSSLFKRVFAMEVSEPTSESFYEQILKDENWIYLIAQQRASLNFQRGFILINIGLRIS